MSAGRIDGLFCEAGDQMGASTWCQVMCSMLGLEVDIVTAFQSWRSSARELHADVKFLQVNTGPWITETALLPVQGKVCWR